MELCRTCVDVDECATERANCPPKSTCANLPGGYNCSCGEGYVPKLNANQRVTECLRESILVWVFLIC